MGEDKSGSLRYEVKYSTPDLKYIQIINIMEVPLLSQDDFFRHLNLRSVHATSVKYHYRQALKERLRASSQVKSLTVNKSSSQQENNHPTKSPTVSPVKWLLQRH